MGDQIPAAILAAGLFAVCSLFICALVFVCFRKLAIFDIPVATSSHNHPVVTAGGWGIFLSIWILAKCPLNLFTGAIFALAVVSFVDDLKGGSPILPRLLVQIGAALLTLFDFQIEQLTTPLWIFLFVFWIVGMINASNFFDGLNGLLPLNVILSGFSISIILLLGNSKTDFHLFSGILAASVCGFLPFNFPKAKLFLGDTGSTVIGFFFGLITVSIFVHDGPILALAVLIPQLGLILDTSFTVCRRMFSHKTWLHPHRGFLFHKLMRSGFTHARVSLSYAGIQFITAILSITAVRIGESWAVVTALVIAVAMWTCSFLFCERRFNSATQHREAAL